MTVDTVPVEVVSGLEETTKWLEEMGFVVIDADHVDMDSVSVPHVTLETLPDDMVGEAMGLLQVLEFAKIPMGTLGSDNTVQIQASYDPMDDSAVVEIYWLDDTRLLGAEGANA